MLQTYLIDGNNLIGKIQFLHRLKSTNPQASREKLSFLVEKFILRRKQKAVLFFDGFEREKIVTSKTVLVYSELDEADKYLRHYIEHSKNKKMQIVVSSDLQLQNFARKCSCKVVPSEEFAVQIQMEDTKDEEAAKIHDLKNEAKDFIKLFDDNVEN